MQCVVLKRRPALGERYRSSQCGSAFGLNYTMDRCCHVRAYTSRDPRSVTLLPQSPAAVLSRSDVALSAKVLFAPERGWRAQLQAWRPAICPFERLLPWVPQDATVLDIGCGAGLLLGILARSGRVSHAVGLDGDANALARATRMSMRVPAATLEFVHVSDTRAWPTSKFDVVLLIDVLHHITPQAQDEFLRAALARVRPGGRFIYKDMAAKPLWYALANRAHDLVLAQQWIHYVSPTHVIEQAIGGGFGLHHREHVRRKWYAHDLLVFELPVRA